MAPISIITSFTKKYWIHYSSVSLQLVLEQNTQSLPTEKLLSCWPLTTQLYEEDSRSFIFQWSTNLVALHYCNDKCKFTCEYTRDTAEKIYCLLWCSYFPYDCDIANYMRCQNDVGQQESPQKLHYPWCTPSGCLAPTDCSVLLSALHGELHPNLRTCDGSKYAGSVHTSVIPMFCGSVTEEALVRAYVNDTPACLDAKSAQLGARNVASVFGDKARLSTMDLRTAGWAEPYRDTRGTSSFVAKLGYWPGWSLLGCNRTPMQRFRWMLLPSMSRLG